MIQKKLFLVPLMLLTLGGPLHAATSPFSWSLGMPFWVDDSDNASVSGNTISWWGSKKYEKSSLTFTVNEFEPLAETVSLGALNFIYKSSCSKIKFVTTLLMNGADNTVQIPFAIDGGKFTANVPSDREYIFTASGHDFKLKNLKLTGDGSNKYNLMGTVSSVPIPATAWLLGAGLLGLIGFRRRQNI